MPIQPPDRQQPAIHAAKKKSATSQPDSQTLDVRKSSRSTQNVAISKRTASRAKLQADTLNVTLKDYVENAVAYFNKYHLNPLEENQVADVPKEVNRLRNHLFGFLREQERQYIIPLIKQVYAIHHTTEHLSGNFDKVVEQLEAIYLLLYKIKTIQDLNLSTLYKAMDESNTQPVGDIVNENTRIFKEEISGLEAKIK